MIESVHTVGTLYTHIQRSVGIYILDWLIQTKTHFINVNAGNLIIYIKIMNSLALFSDDTFKKCLRLRGHYFTYLRII